MQGLLKITSIVFLLWIAQATAAVPLSNQAAFDVVKTSTDELLQLIVDNRKEYQADQARFFEEIDGLLAPVVDFRRIARRIMAKYYKKATIDQREKFEAVFKQSLMKIYAKGLLEFDNQRIEVVPPKRASTSSKKQKVDVVIYSNNGEKFPISYSMFLAKDATWKMENVIVNGINIGLTYRNQFARLMKVNKNDIDLVIIDWTSEVVSKN